MCTLVENRGVRNVLKLVTKSGPFQNCTKSYERNGKYFLVS